jgi:HAD superfamily hydrolase (TIGR01549 family)
MSIKGVLFDLGNTLLYFDGDWPDVLARADRGMFARLEQAGLTLDRQSFLEDFRERLEGYHVQREYDFIEHTTAQVLADTLREYGFENVRKEILADALRGLYAASQAHWLPEDDLCPTLENLRAAGYRLGVLSNAGDDRDVQTLVDKARIRPYLDFVITSAASGMRKPDARIFAMGLKVWGLRADEVVMVGDTLSADILGANRLGIYSIWITRRADRPENRAVRGKIKPDAEIGTLTELPVLLASLSD